MPPPPAPHPSARHQARATALVAMVHISLVAMVLVFGRRAPSVAMVRIFPVAMVLVLEPPHPQTTRQPRINPPKNYYGDE